MPIPLVQKGAIPRTTAKERIYHTLRQWIIAGTLEPGERLNDVELAHYFSVSRTPVREALQLLEEQKLVRVVPSSGTYVAPIDEEDMLHVYQLLIGLQTMALELALPSMTPEDMERLEALNETFLACVKAGTAEDASGADYEFHHALCGLAGNPYLVEFSDQLELQARRNENRFFRESEALYDSYEGHKRILAALAAGDLAAAKAELRLNWDVSLEKTQEEVKSGR